MPSISPFRHYSHALLRALKLSCALLVCGATSTVAPCRAQNAATQATYTNPVLDADRPDPGVIRDKGTFYMVHTVGGVPAWPLYSSPDLIHWTFVKHLLEPANKPAWIKDSLWAPEIHKIGPLFVLTFTAGSNTNGKLCIGMATAPQITGPYTVQDDPIIADEVSVLDSHIFQDDDGRSYLMWKRDGPGGGVGGDIRLQELDDEGAHFKDGSQQAVILASDQTSQPWEKGLVEAPWMLKRDGVYYLVYSGAFIGGDLSYAEGVARSRSLMQRFERSSRNPILSGNAKWGGVGHGAFVTDAAGDLWHLYHARYRENPNDPGGTPPGKGRVQLLDRVFFIDDRPAFDNQGTPSVGPQSAPDLSDFPADVYLLGTPQTLSGTVALQAGADDDKGVSQVDFYFSGWSEKSLGRATRQNEKWTVKWNTLGIVNGQYRVYARATDSGGHVSTSAAKIVTVAN